MQLWIIALLGKLLLVFYFINLSSSQWTFNNNNNNDEYDVNSGWIKVPLKYPSHNYFRRSAQAALDEYSSLNNNNNNNNENTEESGRHFKPETIFKITETLGALNTVGRYLVNITRSGESGKVSKDVPNALYTISKNVLGRNVTDTLAPLVMDALPLKKDKPDRIIQKLDKISKEEEELDDDDDDDDDDEDSKGCKTPEGLNGHCSDLSFCPQLLLNLEHLRRSFCFRTLYQPGVCCPKAATENNHHHQNHQIISTTTTTTTTQATTTKRTLPITFDSIYYNTDNPVSIISTTSKPFSSSSTVSTSAIIAANTPLYHLPPSLPAVVNNFVDPLDCGQPESAKYRVVGGEEALPGRWPWMAAIFLHGSKRTEFWCGGSLISTSHILTAAHCTRDSRQRPFSARQFTVRLGDIDLKRDDEPSSPVTYKVTEIRAHKQFSRVGFYNDIAILKLDRPVRKSKYIIPLCLPSGEIRQEKFAGKRSTVVGWGTTYYGGKESTIQRQAGLPIWRNEDCNQAYFQPITSNFICAGYTEGGTDACQGDSGGPLMLNWDTRWIQIGVVSFGNKCGEPGYPGVYTRITEYLDWIKENTRT